MGNEPSSPSDPPTRGEENLLRAGISAARSGQRERARDLLIRALEQDQQNAQAWLWLSGVVDQVDRQRDCLKRVLALDPDNLAARRGLALLHQQEADRLARAGIAAARAGQRERARDLLIQALEQDQQNAQAWLWLSGVVDHVDRQRDCLKRVLALDPDNQAARRGLALLKERGGELPTAYAEPIARVEPQPVRAPSPDGSTGRRRVSRRAVTLGVLTGVVVLSIGLLAINPSLASYIASQVFPASALPTATIPTLATGEAALPRARQAESDPLEAQGIITATPVHTPAVSPTAAPPPAATPTPVGYPPTRIVIRSIGVDAPIVLAQWHITDTGGTLHQVWDVPEASSAGWHEGSAPLGAIGNTVINGHNWPQNAIFRDLHLIQAGEPITLYSHDLPFVYQVAEVLVVSEAGQPWEVQKANAQYILTTDDERVTVFTCYPYGSIQNRLIVIARPAEPESVSSP